MPLCPTQASDLIEGWSLIPEESMLPEDEEGRSRALEAAGLAAAGQLRRVRSREDGSIFWVRLP